MQKNTIAFLTGAVLLTIAGAVVVPPLLEEGEVPVVRWSPQDEVEVALEAPDADATESELGVENGERVEVETDGSAFVDDGRRIALILRGRVVNKVKAPIADATVWLGYSQARGRTGGRGGTQRQIPDPVTTDQEGRFSFAGETFRNLRVSLQVAHHNFAPGSFDKNLGEVTAEVDLGDLELRSGGEVAGRVTDLAGNGVMAAQIELTPQGRSGWSWMRNRERLLQPQETDNNGYYRLHNVPDGDWAIRAKAHRHTEGRSATFAVEEEKLSEVDDIRLGPGFEATGYVRDMRSQPVAGARVTLRGTGRNGGNERGRGGRGGRANLSFARGYSTETDEQGRFFLEHLPGVPMSLEVRAEGYLTHEQDELDIKLEQPINVTLQDGLRIAGTVVDDTDGQPVTMFAVAANRTRGLPIPGLENVDLGDLMRQMRDSNLDDATRQRLGEQVRSLRESFGGLRDAARDRGRGGRGGDRGDRRDAMDKPESHPDGAFVVTGLQEGIYEVSVQSPDHAFYRSGEIELRHGAAPAALAIRLDRGLFFAGLVVDDDGMPVQGATVELRVAREQNNGGPGGNGRNRDFGNIAREWQRMAAGATVSMDAKTDASGEFIFTHVPKGRYSIRASANGFARSADVEVELQTDRSDGKIVLGALGRIAGVVRGLTEDDAGQAQVAAIRINADRQGGFGRGMGRGGFERAKVEPDGSYAVENLAEGSYAVRAWVGDDRTMMRQFMMVFMGGDVQPDVTVKAGETSKLDVTATRAQVGKVAGTVLHNGEPGKGLQVDLAQVSGGQQEAGGRGGRGGRGGFMRGMQRDTVSGSGTFEIDGVTAGEYTLRIQSENRTTLYEERLFVAADATTERHLNVESSGLRGTVTVDGQPNKEIGGSVTLMPGLTAVPEDMRAWRREQGNSAVTGRIRNGTFEIDVLPPGNYLMVLTVRGRESSSAQVVVGPGRNETTIAAGALSPEGTAPGGQPRQGGQPGSRRGR